MAHTLHLHGCLLPPLCIATALALLASQRVCRASAAWPAAAVAPPFAVLQAAANAVTARHGPLNCTAAQSLLLAAVSAGLVEALLLVSLSAAAGAPWCRKLYGSARAKRGAALAESPPCADETAARVRCGTDCGRVGPPTGHAHSDINVSSSDAIAGSMFVSAVAGCF